MGTSAAAEARRAELAGNLARVRARIVDACTAAGRDRAEITLVAVTKTYPASDVLHLAALGVRDIGENRDQEAAPKAAEVAAAGAAPRWHFIGQLQRNKARSVVRYAHLVHSVDRPELVTALGKARQSVLAEVDEAPLGVLVQVSLDDEPGRGGVTPDELLRLADEVAAHPALALRGLMAVAPLDAPAEPAFARLAVLATRLRAEHPDATAISAGMSGDLETAVAHGATHVRIGSALLGNRAPLR
ncbi:MAG TPA: YggS family pyridoxal phosphate-dependent enzyme [Rugosimonospora sp.]|nr:YggS family pyridoxal phosphate-dependent enzyme [Rugosimonospora sp.]